MEEMKFFQSVDAGSTDYNTIIGSIGNVNPSGGAGNAFTIVSGQRFVVNDEDPTQSGEVPNDMYISSGAGVLTFHSEGLDLLTFLVDLYSTK
mgnify:CR=1 FL=1